MSIKRESELWIYDSIREWRKITSECNADVTEPSGLIKNPLYTACFDMKLLVSCADIRTWSFQDKPICLYNTFHWAVPRYVDLCCIISPCAVLCYTFSVSLCFEKHCCAAPTVDYVCVMREKVPLGRSRLMWGYSQEDERQHLLQTHRFSNQAHSLQGTQTHVDASWCPVQTRTHTHNEAKHQ